MKYYKKPRFNDFYNIRIKQRFRFPTTWIYLKIVVGIRYIRYLNCCVIKFSHRLYCTLKLQAPSNNKILKFQQTLWDPLKPKSVVKYCLILLANEHFQAFNRKEYLHQIEENCSTIVTFTAQIHIICTYIYYI